MGMLGGWYSDPTEQQQALRKTASVRVDTSLGPEYHVRPVASAAQAQPQVQMPVQQQALATQGQTQLSRAGKTSWTTACVGWGLAIWCGKVEARHARIVSIGLADSMLSASAGASFTARDVCGEGRTQDGDAGRVVQRPHRTAAGVEEDGLGAR